MASLDEGPAVKSWYPATYITDDEPGVKSTHDHKYAAIILNQPIEDGVWVSKICSNATLIVCADGGANRLEEAKQQLGKIDITPDFICGDLDSIRPEVRASYEKQGVPIVHDPDQYSTDLTKSLKCIKDWAEKSKVDTLDVMALGGIGGRFDQGFSQLQSLYSASRDESLIQGHLFLANPQSICFMLSQGKNKIHTPLGPGLFGENVGIIPIGRPSTISTKGLEWDVTDWYTEFGGQISTSNHIKDDFVEVETSEQVLFAIELDDTSR